MKPIKELTTFLIALSLLSSTVEASARQPYSLTRERAAPDTTVIQMSSEDYEQIAATLVLLKDCCDSSTDKLNELHTDYKLCRGSNNTLIKMNDNLMSQNDLLKEKLSLSEDRVSDLEDPSWFDTAWDWFWPSLSLALGGVLAYDFATQHQSN